MSQRRKSKLPYDTFLDWEINNAGTNAFFHNALRVYRDNTRFLSRDGKITHNARESAFGICDAGWIQPAIEFKTSMGIRAPRQSQSLAACMREFERCGYNVLTVGPAMAEAFADTSLEHVPLKYLKSPFPAFYLDLTGCGLRCWGGRPDRHVDLTEDHFEVLRAHGMTDEDIKEQQEGMTGTGWHDLIGTYVVWQHDNIWLHHISKENSLSKHPLDVANGWFQFTLFEGGDALNDVRQDIIEGRNPFETIDSTLAVLEKYPDLHLAVDKKIGNVEIDSEKWLQKFLTPEQLGFDGLSKWHDGEAVMAEHRQMFHKLVRIVVNSVLYLNAPKSELHIEDNVQANAKRMQKAYDLMDEAELMQGRVKRRMKRKAERQLQKARSKGYRYIYVGLSIEEKIKKLKESGEYEKRLMKGHIRKGHWHLFHIGPRKDEYGDWIPAHLQDGVHHWLPPSWVGDLDDLSTPRNYVFEDLPT